MMEEEALNRLFSSGREWSDLTLSQRNQVTGVFTESDAGYDQKKLLLEHFGDKVLIPSNTDMSLFHPTPLHKPVTLQEAHTYIQSLDYDVRENMIQCTLNVFRETALHVASRMGESDVSQYLLSHCKDKDKLLLSRNKLGNTPLHLAKNRATAECLLTAASDGTHSNAMLFATNLMGETFLHEACQYGKTDVVRYVMSRNFNKEQLIFVVSDEFTRIKRFQGTALHRAKNTAIAEVLLSSVNPENHNKLLRIVNASGENLLHLACKEGMIEAVELFMSLNIDKDTLLMSLSKDFGRNQSGTPLHIAANEEIAKVLLCNISDHHKENLIHQRNARGETALITACRLGRTGVVMLILMASRQKLALINIPDKIDNTALHWAQNREMAALILQPFEHDGLLLNDFTSRVNLAEETALHIACKGKKEDVVEYLLTINIDKDKLIFGQSRRFEGKSVAGTALHCAASKATAELLIKSVSTHRRLELIQKKNIDGETAYQTAARQGKEDVMEFITFEHDGLLLNDFTSKVNLAEETALHIACKEKKEDVVEYLLTRNIDKDKLIFGQSRRFEGKTVAGTALHCAASNATAELLIKSVSTHRRLELIQKKNVDGETAYQTAAKQGKEDVMEFITATRRKTHADEAPVRKFDTPVPIKYQSGQPTLITCVVTQDNVPHHRKTGVATEHQHTSADTVSSVYSSRLVCAEIDHEDHSQFLSNFNVDRRGCLNVSNEDEVTIKDEVTNEDDVTNEDEVTDEDEVTNEDEVTIEDYVTNEDEVTNEASNHVVTRYQIRDEKVCLEHACAFGLTEDVRTLLSNNWKLIHSLVEEDFCETMLHKANNPHIAKLLLNSVGADERDMLLFTANLKGLTALHTASLHGRTGVVRYLLNLDGLHKERLIAKCSDMIGTALHFAANIDIAELIINSIDRESLEEFIVLVNEVGETALHKACQNGAADIVTLLLSLDIREKTRLLNIQSRRSSDDGLCCGTALHCAKDSDIARILVNAVRDEEYNIFVSLKNQWGETAMDTARNNNRDDVVRFLSAEVNLPLQSLVDPVLGVEGTITAELKSIDKLSNQAVRCDVTGEKNIDGETSLHLACHGNHTDAVKSLLDSVSGNSKEQLVLAQDGIGNTALHHTSSAAIAKLLVSQLSDPKRGQFIFTINKKGFTALHNACDKGWTEIVEYFFSYGTYEWVDGKKLIYTNFDEVGTALHYAKNSEIAEMLIHVMGYLFEKDELEFISERDSEGATALHVACLDGNIDVIKHFWSLAISREKLVLCSSDKYGSPLHLVANKDTAELVMKVVSDKNKESLLLLVNATGETALHTACNTGHSDVVKYFMSLQMDHTKLIKGIDINGNSALHNVPDAETTKLLSNILNDEDLNTIMCTPNVSGHTPLHSACKRGDERVIRCLLSIQESRPKVFQLHEPAEADGTVLSLPDLDGNTPLMLAINSGSVDASKRIKETMEYGDEYDLTLQNKDKQNVFHLISRSLRSEEFAAVFAEDIKDLDSSALFTQDKDGNTPIHYAAGLSNTKLVAAYCMLLSLAFREKYLAQHNVNKVNVSSIIARRNQQRSTEDFYLREILNDRKSYALLFFYKSMSFEAALSVMDRVITQDPILQRIVKYAMNEYVITDPGSMYLLSSFHKHSSKAISGMTMTEGVVCVDERLFHEKEAVAEIQDMLLNMGDDNALKDTPKIVVRRKINSEIKISPPGPDFAIVEFIPTELTQIELDTSWMTRELSNDLRVTVDQLRHDDGTMSVTVNSTLCSHLGAKEPTGERLMVTGSSSKRGKALLLSNKEGRRDWKIQYDDALHVLGQQFGMQVKSLFDIKGYTEEIGSFARGSDHGQIVVLVIIAHGDTRGNITDIEGMSCSVQAVVDALCIPELERSPKIIMLSFCRGEIAPKYNRTIGSIASLALEDFPDMKPITKAFTANEELKRKKRAHSFPQVNIPADCYVFYTTLPDSKSAMDSIVFKEMKQYLSDIVTESHDHNSAADRGSEASGGRRGSESEENVRAAHVELLNLFTNVAGIVRQKSRAQTYTNHCYTVDRHSKTVIVDVCKGDSC